MKVSLLITCLGDAFFPQAGVATVKLLRRLGVEVDFPEAQTCCGQPQFNSGFHDLSRDLARHTIRAFANGRPVVTPSGSCAAMVKHGYPDLFADDPVNLPRAEAVAARTFEFSQYLVHELGLADVGARYDGPLTYHASCHLLRGLREKDAPLILLKHVRGATLVELPGADECCGFGGLFAVKMPEISGEMLARKLANIRAAAPTVVTCDAGCLTHINGGLHRAHAEQRVVHLAQILASA